MADYQSTAPTTTAVTLQEAKAHLNVSTTHDDALIISQIKAATDTLEARSRRCFVTQTRITKADDFSDKRYVRNGRLYPERSPLKSVTSLKYVATNGTTTTIASTDYIVSTGDNPGYVACAYEASWPSVLPQPNSVILTYVAGHSTVSGGVPERCKQAVKFLVGHWYRNREAVITSGAISKEIEWTLDAIMESEQQEAYA